MKTTLLSSLLLVLISCEEDAQGKMQTTWLFWAFLCFFILLIVLAVIEGNANSKRAKEQFRKAGLNPDALINAGSYVGGHPRIDNQINTCVIYKKENDLIIGEVRDIRLNCFPAFRGSIPIKNIKEISLEDASTIENKVTLGRVILVGVFALVWRKKKKSELTFITIQWEDGKFSHITIFSIEGVNAMQTANIARNRLIRDVSNSPKNP